MDKYDATEAAYKAGYEAGKRDAVEQGEWVTPTSICGRAWDIPHCSVCGGVPVGVDRNTKYCANCGARMDKEAAK